MDALLLAFLELVKLLPWASQTLYGFLLMVFISGTVISFYLLAKHLILSQRRHRQHEERARAQADERIATLERQIVELTRLMNVERIECRQDALMDAGFQSSLTAIAGGFQTLLMGVLGGSRVTPPEFAELRQDLSDVRRKIHEERNRRADRLASAKRTMEIQLPR
jgi:hypothetical protein